MTKNKLAILPNGFLPEVYSLPDHVDTRMLSTGSNMVMAYCLKNRPDMTDKEKVAMFNTLLVSDMANIQMLKYTAEDDEFRVAVLKETKHLPNAESVKLGITKLIESRIKAKSYPLLPGNEKKMPCGKKKAKKGMK